MLVVQLLFNKMKPYPKKNPHKTAGFMFEIKLLTLFMLRVLSNNQDFHMATEMIQEKVGKYDDVVFIFEDSVGDKRSFLVQCKHTSPKKGTVSKLYKGTLLSNKDEHFGIIHYLRSYLERIKENHELGVVDGLVLFTNREVDNKMIEHKDLIKLGDNDREFMKFCLAPRWVKDDVMPGKHQDGVEKILGQQRRVDSFFSLSEKFVNKLKPILIKHYLNEISFNFLKAVLKEKKIVLSWDSSKSAFDRYKSSVYYKILDLKESTDRTFSIKGLKEDFVKKADYLRDFRQKFVKHLGTKFINPNVKVSDIESLQEYFKTCDIIVEMTDTFISTTDLSLEEIISDTDLKNFQKLFVLAAGQPNVKVIENVIAHAVKQQPVLQNVNPCEATKFLISHVHEWVDSAEGYYIDLNKATRIINRVYSESMLSRANFSIWDRPYTNIFFEKTRLDDLNNLLQANKSSTVQISCKGSAKLLMLQLRQTSSTKDYLYLDCNLIDKWMGEGIDLPKFLKASKSFVGVVIDLTSYRNYHSSEIDSFVSSGKKMIVIVPHNTPIDKLRDVPNISTEPLETNFNHLSSESRDDLCSKQIFNVHGRMRSIDDLLPNIVDLNISDDVLNDLLLVNKLVIGEVPNSLSNLPAAYFKTEQKISPDYFINILREKRCMFAISVSEDTEESLLSVFSSIDSDLVKNHITHEDCLNLEKNIILFHDDDLEKFCRICEKNNTSVIYRIHIDNGTLVVTEIFNPNYYIERQFMLVREVTFTKFGLNEYFLKTNVSDLKRCLIIARESPCSSTDEWDKSAPVFVCHVEEAEDFFKNKCLQTDPKFDEVHWLNFHGTEFKLVKSHGSMAFIREYENIYQKENHQRIELSDENKLFDEVHSNVVLICDEAGTGKSTTLVSMCNKLMTSNCVYMIDLKNVEKLLKNLMNGKINQKDCVIKLLTLNGNSALLSFIISHLLQKSYDESDGLTLIFDGIDDVFHKYQKEVIKIMTYIANETMCRICIASRKTCQPLLENQFCQLAITIEGMSLKAQQKLIDKQWQASFLHHDEFLTSHITRSREGGSKGEKKKEYPTKIISTQMKNIFGITEFAALPLYLRLMYEIYMRDLEKGDMSVSSINNVKQLFDEIVQIRYTIYYAGEYSDRLNEHNRLHAEFAFRILFPDESEDCDAKGRLIDQRSTYLLIGMLHSRGPGHIDFIHQTFCEYFCAMYLVDCLNKRNKSHLYKTAQRLLCQDWFWPRSCKKFDMLAQFVNAMLEEDITIKGRQKDRLGRSIEHMYAYNNCVYELKSKINLRKDILGRTPLYYAIDKSSKVWWLFFKSDAVIKRYHDNVLYRTWTECEGTPSSFYSGNIAFESSEWNRIVNAKDTEKHSCLFYAAERQNWDACVLLLSLGADCKALSEPQRDKLLLHIKGRLAFSSIRPNRMDSHFMFAALIPLLNNKQLILDTDGIYGVYGNGLVVLTVDGKFELSDHIFILHFVDQEHLTIIKHLVQLNILTLVASYIKRVVEWGHIETFKYLQQMMKPEDNPLPVYMQFAILYNRASIVKFIWRSYKELATDTGGRTPLMVAADCGNLRFVEYFCEKTPDVNVKSKFGDTALHYAVKSRTNLDLNIIKHLVDQGANVHLKNGRDITTLDIFIDWDDDYSDGSQDYQTRFECIRFLVQDCKAESKYGDQAFREQIVSATHDTVNARVDGSTLLHKAVSMSAHGFVAYLLYKGADVYAKDVSGRTVLDISFSGDQCDRILFRYATQCSQYKWKEIPKEKRGELILGDTMAARRGDNREVNLLIANCAMFDAVNNEGLTPDSGSIDKNISPIFDEVSLHFQKVAVKNKSLNMTYLLLKHGADFNPMDKRCRRLLEDEEKKKQSENPCVATLRRIQHVFMSTQKCQFDEALGTLRSLQSDADFVVAVIHSRDRKENTLLHHAAAVGNIDIAKFVLSNGGCYNPLNNCRKSPLDVTRSTDIYTLLSFLDYLDVTHLWKSDLEDYKEAIVNARDRHGESTFDRVSCLNVIKWLLKSNPNFIDISSPNFLHKGNPSPRELWIRQKIGV